MLSSLSPERWPEPGAWSLARHPEGWFLMPCGAGEPWLLWDRVEGRFSDGAPELPMAERSVEASRELAAYWLDAERLEPMLVYPYWGYAGAAEHSLLLLQGEGELDPAQLYAAGKLLLAAASGLLGERMPAGSNAILLGCAQPPSTEKEMALAWLSAAVDALERLERAAPDFMGAQGGAELERALMAGRAWAMLLDAGRQAEASGFLERARFPDFYEAHGRNLLRILPLQPEWTASGELEWVLLRCLQAGESLRKELLLGCCREKGTSWEAGLSPQPDAWSALLTDEFRFEGADRARAAEPAARRIAAGYRKLGLGLALSQAGSGRPDEGLRVLNVLYRHLPEWVFAPSAAELEVVGFYYRYGSAERGGEIGLALYRVLAALPPEARTGTREAMAQLDAWAAEHSQTELQARYAELRKASPR
jgi:hypothetical protein